MSMSPPPIREPLADSGDISLSWLKYFNQTYYGDAGSNWTPTFQNLATVGTPTIAGRYLRISQFLCYFVITITPGTNTSSVTGTTYCDNFPLTPTADGFVLSLSNNLGGGLGMVSASSNKIYPPTWTTVTTPITLIGMVEAA